MELFKAKLQMIVEEGERVRVRFSVPGAQQAAMGDFLVPPDHPSLDTMKVGKVYSIVATEVVSSA